jgi:hypothetical protein
MPVTGIAVAYTSANPHGDGANAIVVKDNDKSMHVVNVSRLKAIGWRREITIESPEG